MGKKKKKKINSGIRSKVGLQAHNPSGSGVHGGTPKQNNKRSRRAAKQEVRDYR